ncbi:MAG TPA: hypothetical protein VKZ18_17800 [Polyangia bacterium]|nr:hypothetical protein [Polyangia bacterium]
MKPSSPPPLDADLRALIDAAHGADEPNELNRARVRRAVEVQLAAGAGAALVGSGVALAGAVKAVVVAVVVVGVAGAGVYVRQHQARRHRAQPDRLAAAVAAPSSPDVSPEPSLAPALAPPAAPAERPSAAPSAVRRRSRPGPVQSAAPVARVDLAEEVRLLGAANGALARHDVVSARALLAEYDRRPGVGVLAEERAVAGILASCAEGRADVARADVGRFHARWPRSPLAARVDRSCAGRPVTPSAAP